MSAPGALLTDFGGVLTTSVYECFEDFCAAEGLPADHFVTVVGDHPEGRRLLAQVETGEIGEEEFEASLAPLLGPEVVAAGLVGRLTAALDPDPAMIATVAELRRSGVRTVLVSNSLGYSPYEGWGLEQLFDAQVISGRARVRKPSRRIYELALAEAGVEAQQAVFVDDLQHNVEAAGRLGMRAIHHTESEQTVGLLRQAFEIGV